MTPCPTPTPCPADPGTACPCDCYRCEPPAGQARQAHCNSPKEATVPSRLSAEDLLRYSLTVLAVVGLAGLSASVGGIYGTWAAFALLLAVGLALGVPLWLRALTAAADARERAAASSGQEPFRGVPAAPGSPEDGGGSSYPMPGG